VVDSCVALSDHSGMKPFTYHRPATLKAATGLLARWDGRARLLAGGTDLLVRLRSGALAVDHVVDIKQIPETTRITFDARRGLTFGAAVACADLCADRDAARRYPALTEAAGLIGGAAIQSRATIGGNLCNAAPSADSAPALIVLDARCLIAGPAGRRWVAAADFCTAPGRTALAAGELLVAIRVPLPPPRSGAAYERFIPRGEMDIAVAGAAAWLALERGLIGDARISLAAVAPTPLAAVAAAAALAGKPAGDDAFTLAAAAAREAARPITDVRGSAEQRLHLVEVLVRRVLERAAERAAAGRS
jgi:carbon-monoxide dehydrogenase medium subunit